MLKWIGAVLVLAGCGGWGFCAAWQMHRQETELRQLSAALEFMSCELACRQTPLPVLLEASGQVAHGIVGNALTESAQMMQQQRYPDAGSCIDAALKLHPTLPKTDRVLRLLGSSLGRFDLPGQQAALTSVHTECRRILQQHCADLSQRVRSYRILGFCAGGALAILLL